MDVQDGAKLEGAKRGSMGHRLMRCARLFNEAALARVRAETGLPIRAIHTTLFPHVDLGGTRLTTLAERVGVTKQAAGELVEELVEMGVLERVADSTDGRARLIRSRGAPAALVAGISTLVALEADFEAEVGEADAQGLRAGLLSLEAFLSRDRA
jgi:DNA-binding MarR family transcriptional regulator